VIAPVVAWADVPAGAVLVDVRWYLDGRDGRAGYIAGHVPGARFVDLDTVLAGPAGGVDGRHPLPSPEVFATGLGAAGAGDDDVVVAYDDARGIAASRLVWMLRILGCDAAVVDGGLGAWPGQQGPAEPTGLERGWPTVIPVTRRPRPWPDGATVDADGVAALVASGGVVGDSRAAARYAGEPHPLDTASGHIPGAVSMPFEDVFGEDGRFQPPATLRRRFDEAGVTAGSAFYCGSGVSACVNVLAAEHAGLGRPLLYVGSWSGWTADPARAIEQ
jgi:thiosulfate/3-mercaptopyruvate sulfurtransferase